MFRSPTCTALDRGAEDLARIAGIDCEQFATEMFAAGSNLRGKSPEEIFYQDFKKFELNKANFGVGQINSMNPEELEEIKERLIPYMEKNLGTHGETMLFSCSQTLSMSPRNCCVTAATASSWQQRPFIWRHRDRR